jgi:ABC-type transport system involved in multi-copper enzyme maturation permease subunit
VRFREVFRYEFEYRIRSASTWIYATVLFGLAFLILYTGGPGNPEVQPNAPIQITFLALLLGLFGLPVSAALFGDAAVRDVRVAMDPLLYTSPLGKAEYLGGRFLAAVAVNAILLLAIPIGFALPVLIGRPDPAALGPFRAGAYVQMYLVFLLPNMVFSGAVMFAAGVLTRKVLPVYLVGVAFFMISMFVMGAGEGAVVPVLSVIGPLGYHALNEITEYWTAAEQNTRLIGLSANLAWNRIFWLAVSAMVFGLLHRKFRFAHPDGGRALRKRSSIAEVAPGRPAPVAVPRVAGSFGFRTGIRQTLAVARQALEESVLSRWFVAILVGCVGLTMLWGWNVGDSVFDTSTWPVTFLVAETVLTERIVPLIYVLIALFAGELVWKEREVGVAEIADAMPVPGGPALLGRLLAFAAILAMILAAMVTGGILIQAFQGYTRFEIGLYFRIVFGLNLAGYLLLAILAMTIHVLVNHKNIGHIIVLLAIVFTRAASTLGIQHHLLVYGSDPGWVYSDMNGFGPFIAGWIWFKLYWAGWALLLAVIAALFWVRGREQGLRRRLALARARFIGSAARAAALAVILILGLGGFIFYNTNILNQYRSPDEAAMAQAEYEKRYGRYESYPQPSIMDATLRVEIFPGQRAVDLAGSYRLVNLTGAPIDSVHVYLNPDVDARTFSFSHPARATLVDEAAGYRIFVLDRAVQPGDSVRLAFDVTFRPRGFRNSDNPTDVAGNGAYFHRIWLPFIGYQPAFELADNEARARLGLKPQPPMAGPDDLEARRFRSVARNEDRVRVDAMVGTAADQIAITSGVLRRSWTENGRRYFHYQTETLTGFSGTFFSGKYAVVEDRWSPPSDTGAAVSLQLFHHPGHTFNLDHMVRGMKASLSYYTAQFGPYQGSQLRIVETPRYGGFGHAHPQIIAFTEDAVLSRVREGEVDQPFFGTAHEVAHQWWPGQVRGAMVRGERMLSEALANYSAMMVTEKTYGMETARRVYDFQMERYLRGRAVQAREVPLLEVEDQPYIAYRKGAIAMYALRDQIGEEAVSEALRRYLAKYRDTGPPYPTSRDLYAELRAVTPDSLGYLLTDLFETVTLWDVRAERAEVERNGRGEYVVTLDVVAKKLRADRAGHESEVPMNDLVEIGIFGPGSGGRLGPPLYLKQHRVKSGPQRIRVTVPQEPARAGIDPYSKLIDRQRDDNLVGTGDASP